MTMGNYTSNRDHNAKIRGKITKTERNAGIADRFNRGQITKASLARMYQLSETRIGQIIKQYTPQPEQEGKAHE